ncbi:formyl transferase [Methylobacterium sp. BTF04]|uniref:glucosamine inositolphosphorylceramide transferase family protein n=1 Tax=Methylobacterium sp. BTF04 TaxID=2708300 RepID=UPI0013D51C94|nr:formyl transferase [Methylobacterium sp. BTF04]NEU12367.1 formyl transferase [Methylobacterium sp. BTF04]
MRLSVRLDGRNIRLWHLRLLAAAAALPRFVVTADPAPGADGLPDNAALLFRLEALIAGLPRDGVSAPAAPNSLAAYVGRPAEPPEVILDLCGDAQAGPATRVWHLAFDGVGGESALFASLLAGRLPIVTLHDGARLLAAGRLGTERRGMVLTSFEDALVRTTSLILSVLAGGAPMLEPGTIAGIAAPPPVILSRTTLGARALKLTARAVARRLYRLCYRAPHWRVGWRHLDGPDLLALRAHPESGWHVLPDDGLRFYADPFPIVHAGRTVLFVEDYAHALGKGIISAVAFGPDGPLGTPIPVLEEAHHLSYPFVFAHDGAHWMIPESGDHGTVDLYRATAFPGGWVKEATLLSGLTASDATLVEHGGCWWMFATVRAFAPGAPPRAALGSYSDGLHLWSALDFRGPWIPHPGNPVLVDIAASRPAGRIVAQDGVLIRPTQDCRLGYGEALSLARIDRLDTEGYCQTVETTLRAGPLFPGHHLHTLNRTAAFEFIDGSGRLPRLGMLRSGAKR